ncbi:MAG: gamma carbonic anhydrase family protein [Lactimicrobium sp.]|jgi:carbonic anhydrase/acetyltransferase-like protein (isoleucine patch superfamily)|uniref:gamma carbonic anhydrase family protein n=1 Tax=Lactimicrobium sp. TaxID=2563780 RepID=UPI002F354120
MKAYYTGIHTVITGTVSLQENSSVWHNAVLRGDMEPIAVGANTNIQDLVMVHGSKGHPVTIGNNVTVGHSAIIHGCTIDDNVLVGMGAIIMNGAHIHANTIVAAGALVPQDKEYPEGVLIIGVPGRIMRNLSKEEIENIQKNADNYCQLAKDSLIPHSL